MGADLSTTKELGRGGPNDRLGPGVDDVGKAGRDSGRDGDRIGEAESLRLGAIKMISNTKTTRFEIPTWVIGHFALFQRSANISCDSRAELR